MANLSTAEKPLLPLFISNWIFGIGVIEYPLGKPRKFLSSIHSALWIVLLCTIASISHTTNYHYLDDMFPVHFSVYCLISIAIVLIFLGRYFDKVHFYKILIDFSSTSFIEIF